MFTTATAIPTVLRAQIRALVKNHPAWKAFVASKGILSASAKNADLLEFALQHAALAQSVEALLTSTAVDDSDDSAADDSVDAADTVDADMVDAPVKAGAFVLDDILAGVDQFLGSRVRDEIAKALQPVVDAANTPVEVERIVEVERVVEVAAGAAGVVRVVAPKARPDKKVTFRSLFPGKGKEDWNDKPLTMWTGVKANDVDPFYVVDRKNMAALATAVERGMNCWLTGPAAGGKSTMPKQLAATLGRPCVNIEMTRQTEIADMVGGMSLQDGKTVWTDGVLVQAMKSPGTIIVIEELTIAPAGVQAIFLHAASEFRSLTLPTGEVVKAAPGVVFVVADNTAGAGDEGGLYAGTNVASVALVSRFPRMLFIDYMSPASEAEALSNHTAAPLEACRHLADFVANCRKLSTLSGVIISLRQLIGFIRTYQDGFSVKDAFSMSISSRMPATERATIDGMVDLVWSNAFAAMMSGKAAPAAPSDSNASKAFADNQF